MTSATEVFVICFMILILVLTAYGIRCIGSQIEVNQSEIQINKKIDSNIEYVKMIINAKHNQQMKNNTPPDIKK